jgi:hypothetical protein
VGPPRPVGPGGMVGLRQQLPGLQQPRLPQVHLPVLEQFVDSNLLVGSDPVFDSSVPGSGVIFSGSFTTILFVTTLKTFKQIPVFGFLKKIH